MNDAIERRAARSAARPTRLRAVLPACALAAVPLALDMARDGAANPACVILLAAALFYLAVLGVRARALGYLATGLAALGALGIGAGLLSRWLAGVPGFPAQHDMVALFSALAVLGYLAMERIYRTRDAGAVTLALVGSALLLGTQAADTAPGATPPAGPALLALYADAARLVGLIAYGALTVAAVPALLLLSAHGAEPQAGAPHPRLPAAAQLRRLADDWLLAALAAGALALLTTVLLASWTPVPRWPWPAAVPWAPALAYLYGALVAHWPAGVLARLAVAAGTLSAATVAILLRA